MVRWDRRIGSTSKSARNANWTPHNHSISLTYSCGGRYSHMVTRDTIARSGVTRILHHEPVKLDGRQLEALNRRQVNTHRGKSTWLRDDDVEGKLDSAHVRSWKVMPQWSRTSNECDRTAAYYSDVRGYGGPVSVHRSRYIDGVRWSNHAVRGREG